VFLPSPGSRPPALGQTSPLPTPIQTSHRASPRIHDEPTPDAPRHRSHAPTHPPNRRQSPQASHAPHNKNSSLAPEPRPLRHKTPSTKNSQNRNVSAYALANSSLWPDAKTTPRHGLTKPSTRSRTEKTEIQGQKQPKPKKHVGRPTSHINTEKHGHYDNGSAVSP
jgi:hypothetical protein